MEAMAMKVKSLGPIRDFNVTPLLPVDESIAAMKKASSVEIIPPSK
jgi:hypothetical protein